jgi:O-antigen/teichoic acid export membrane protein
VGLAKNSIGTFISKSAIYVLRFPIGILVARFLGPEGKGLLYLLLTSITICVSLGNLGLGPASTYFIGKDRMRLPAVVGNLLAVASVIWLVAMIAAWVFFQYVRPDLYSRLPLWIWIVVIFLIPSHFLSSSLMQVLMGILRIKEINFVEVTAITIQLLLLIPLMVILDMGITGAFLAYAVSNILATCSFFVLVLHYGGWPTKPDSALLGASLRYGIKSYLSNLMRFLNLRLDAFMVATLAMSGAHATGIYSVSVGLAELIFFIPTSIRRSLFPMVAAQGTTVANRLTAAACRHTIFLTGICALVLATLGPFIIYYLYGKRFVGAMVPLLILLPGVVMLSQARIFYSDLNGRGKPEATAISALLSLIVTVILDFVLIPRFGIVGAALASTCAYTTEFFVAGLFFIHNSGTLWREMLIIRRSDLSYYFKMLPRTGASP